MFSIYYTKTRRLYLISSCFAVCGQHLRPGSGWGYTPLIYSFSFFHHRFYSPRSTRKKRLYPQRPSGEAVVTLCLLFSPPVLAFIFIARRVQHSHFSAFSARRFPTDFAPGLYNLRSTANIIPHNFQVVNYQKHGCTSERGFFYKSFLIAKLIPQYFRVVSSQKHGGQLQRRLRV